MSVFHSFLTVDAKAIPQELSSCPHTIVRTTTDIFFSPKDNFPSFGT